MAPLIFASYIAVVGLLACAHYRNIVPFLKSPLFKFLALVLTLFVVAYVRVTYLTESPDPEDLHWVQDRIERFSLVLGIGFVFYVCSTSQIEKSFVVAGLLIPIPILIAWVSPDTIAGQSGERASGLFLNANHAGEGVLLWLVIIAACLPRLVFFTIFIISGIAIVTTFSRSGLLGWVVLGAYFFYTKKFSKILLIVPFLLVVFYATFLQYAEIVISYFVEGEQAVAILMDRLNFFSDIGSDEALDDSSSEERFNILQETWRGALERPIIGHGGDSKFFFGLSSHNVLLSYFYTYGILGVALYFYLAKELFKYGRQSELTIFSPVLLLFVLFTPFNHSHFNEHYWYIAYAYVFTKMSVPPNRPLGYELRGSSGGSKKRRRKKKRKSSSRRVEQQVTQ